MAKDVRVTFDPPLPDPDTDPNPGDITPFLQRRYAKAIPTFPPGAILHNVYQTPGDGQEPVPDEADVIFEYTDDHGRPYRDMYRISVTLLKTQTTSNPADTDWKGLAKRGAKAAEAIARGIGRP